MRSVVGVNGESVRRFPLRSLVISVSVFAMTTAGLNQLT